MRFLMRRWNLSRNAIRPDPVQALRTCPRWLSSVVGRNGCTDATDWGPNKRSWGGMIELSDDRMVDVCIGVLIQDSYCSLGRETNEGCPTGVDARDLCCAPPERLEAHKNTNTYLPR